MITKIDETSGTVTVTDAEGERTYPLASSDGFAAVSRAWLRAGWDAKYVYSFAWFGRPVIQLPDDLIRIQEVIYALKPDVIIETGVAHGGSLVFYATLCKALDKGKVIGIDIEIRPHNRQALDAHELRPLITLIEGSSIDPATIAAVDALVPKGATVLVLLDSNHTRDHVLDELRGYAHLVSPGSYIVATDGIMAQVAGAPRTSDDWTWNNPLSAIEMFLAERSDFVAEEPGMPFNEGFTTERVSYWPRAYIRRTQ